MASDGEETIKLVKELAPDVALLDIAMPKSDGIETAKQINAICPSTSIIIVSAYKYDHYVLACMQAGVKGYLLKNTPRDDMINAIRMVNSGEVVFSHEATKDIIRHLADDTKKVKTIRGGLQKREIEVLDLASRGFGNKGIATELGISENTVASHFQNIFRKLGVDSRTEATLHAFREGWITNKEPGS
jgi:DNA-binding NarL/FixJ family response regulator